MKFFWIFCLALSFLGFSCAQKKTQTQITPSESGSLSILSKPKNLGEVFKIALEDSESSVTDSLGACYNPKVSDICDQIFEKGVAGRIQALHIALVTKDTVKILAAASTTGADFHKLLSLYSEQREYLVPVTFEAWSLASALTPYSKAVSRELYAEVKAARSRMEARSPKPVGFYFLEALETEFQKVSAHGKVSTSEKVQAYKRCVDAEPSNRRCQEAYLRLAAKSPTAIKTSESNLAKECRPSVDKSGFSLKVGTTSVNKSFGGPKPFFGEKYYFDRREILGVTDIEGIYWNKKGPTINLELTDAGVAKIKKASAKTKGKGLLLMKKDMIFAAVSSKAAEENTQEIRFPSIDKQGLTELLQKCP